MFLCADAQFIKLHNIERANEQYNWLSISPPYEDYIPVTDTNGVLRYIHKDSIGADIIGLVEDEVLFGKVDGTIEQSPNLVFINNDSLVLDSALTINGLSGLTPTTVKVLKDGRLEFSNPLETNGSIWNYLKVKPLQQSQGNVDWNEGLLLAQFSGTRWDNIQYEGWNIRGGNVEVAGKTGFGRVWEDHYDDGLLDRTEMNYIFIDSLGNQYRPLSVIINKGSADFADWYSYFTVGDHFLLDPRNNNKYAQFRVDADTSISIMTLWSPKSVNTRGVEFYYDGYATNQLSITPLGTSNSTLNILFPFTKTETLRRTVSVNPTYYTQSQITTLAGNSSDGYFGTVSFPIAADSIAQYITFEGGGFDSLITCQDSMIGFIIGGDTICISMDSIFIVEPCVYGISMGDTLAVCVPEGTPGLNIYNSNGSLTNTPGANRLVDMDTAAVRFRRGTSDRLVIERESANQVVTIRGGATKPQLELVPLNAETGRTGIQFNGLTDATHVRDYGLYVNPGGSGSFMLTDFTFADPWLQYFGLQDSIIVHKGIKLDGIVWDEDGDTGATGEVLVAQADGTLNWTAGGAGGENIYNHSDTIPEVRDVYIGGVDSVDLNFHLWSNVDGDEETGTASNFNVILDDPDGEFNVFSVKGTDWPNDFNPVVNVYEPVTTRPGLNVGYGLTMSPLAQTINSVLNFSMIGYNKELNISTVIGNDSLFEITTNGGTHLTFDEDLARTKAVSDFGFAEGLRDKDGDLGTSGQVLSSTGTQVNWIDPGGAPISSSISGDTLFIGSDTVFLTDIATETFSSTFDGGGSELEVGATWYTYVPYDCYILSSTLFADQTGSTVIGVWNDSRANYPPTVADDITASATPEISAGIIDYDATLTGWDRTISADSFIGFTVESVTDITRATITITVVKR